MGLSTTVNSYYNLVKICYRPTRYDFYVVISMIFVYGAFFVSLAFFPLWISGMFAFIGVLYILYSLIWWGNVPFAKKNYEEELRYYSLFKLGCFTKWDGATIFPVSIWKRQKRDYFLYEIIGTGLHEFLHYFFAMKERRSFWFYLTKEEEAIVALTAALLESMDLSLPEMIVE